MIECDPAASFVVANVAFPALFSEVVLRTVAPSLNVTLPVGVPEAPGVTITVKVTDFPRPDGFADDESEVVVVAVIPKLVVSVPSTLPA